MSRLSELMASMPLGNISVMGLICMTYLYQLLGDPPLHNFTMCPRNVIYGGDYYRVISSALFHGGLMHVGMNLMSFSAIGSLLEKTFGTFKHVITILWGILLTSFVYIFASLILDLFLGIDQLMYQHSVGFSGVIFHLSILESSLSPDRSRSVFGFFHVPSSMYPWALLIVLQFIMPQISFMGHLSGILVGTLQVYGGLDFLLPSNVYLKEMEEWEGLHFLTKKKGFVKMPEESLISERAERGGIRVAICVGVMFVWKMVRDIAETIKVCIFGYGNRSQTDTVDVSEDWDDDDVQEWRPNNV